MAEFCSLRTCQQLAQTVVMAATSSSPVNNTFTHNTAVQGNQKKIKSFRVGSRKVAGAGINQKNWAEELEGL
jgi:hypothetical protein